MENEEKLYQLRLNIKEISSPFFNEEELYAFLLRNDFDVEKASYEALIYKAENDSISLPSGMQIPDNRKYWLTLAKRFRKNKNQNLLR